MTIFSSHFIAILSLHYPA